MENSNNTLVIKKCKKCGIELVEHQIDEHNMRCGYAFNISDYENLIPCEICQELISFEDYESHIQQCTLPYRNISSIFTNSSSSAFESASDIEHIQSQLNNDPVARVLFNFMIGQPLPTNPVSDGTEAVLAEGTEAVLAEGTEAVLAEGTEAVVAEGTEAVLAEGTDTILNNTFIDFFNNLPNSPNIDSFINNIVTTSFQFDNNNDNMMSYEELTNLDDVEIGITDIDKVSKLQFLECECPICCQTCLLSRKTKCGHIYCDSCLTKWLKTNKKCPTCMIDLE
tara:strand:+ start:1127 stop:1972 length:846 start_codon:yes stop_codon:yes gene_type:complete